MYGCSATAHSCGNQRWNSWNDSTARLLGWHRRFCLWQWRYRGSKSKPALMMALDRGGSCVGIVFRIAAPDVSLKLAKVWEREMMGKGYRPQWVGVQADGKALKAITFVADQKSYRYAGRLDESLIAKHIATAWGLLDQTQSICLRRYCIVRKLAFGIACSSGWRPCSANYD